MNPVDLEVIYGRLNNLSTEFNFEEHSRPYIFQEVINSPNEAVLPSEYYPFGAVTEFNVGTLINT